MKLGIGLPLTMPALADIVVFARGVEQLGYDSLWVGDRLVAPVEPITPYPSDDGVHPSFMRRMGDPIVLWSAAAAATSRIRLNSSTLNAAHYQPVHLARALTTLEVISGGRLDIGLGLGWMRDEWEAAGADWRQRGRRLDDLLSFLCAWWTTNPVEHHSPFVNLPPTHVDLRPVQPGGPPIWLGGASPAALRRVGRSATGWLPFEGLPEATASELWDLAKRSAEEAGRDPSTLRRALRINAEPGTTAATLADRLARAAEAGMDESLVELAFLNLATQQSLDLAAELIGLRRW